ncbi:L,D-transpeptidase [Actinoplanes sp. NPDC026619]|uniref:L,D-transpeptidase n=1 Tax=Actinoplanes sp. NPDC026619 TaxID=3155798 RepID=UPI0033C5B1D8
MRRGPSTRRRTASVTAAVLAFGIASCSGEPPEPPESAPVPSPSAAPSAPAPSPSAAPATVAPAAKPTGGLKTISYTHVPAGFPADPAPASLGPLTEGLHPTRKLAVYDAPGGTPHAYLAPTIRGVPVVVPIVAKKPGWSAVLLPSVNRRIGWLPDRGWTAVPLRDQVIVRLSDRTLTWLRGGVLQKTWTVGIGATRTPTPLGRTFVLGRTGTHGHIYAGLDALVLGAVPDDRGAVAPGLQNAHTGIHAWYRKSVFGHRISNGCVRMPAAAQQTLLDNLAPGTPITVL